MATILRKQDLSVLYTRATKLCLPSVVGLNSKRRLTPYNRIPRAPILPVVGSLPYILKKGYLYYHEYVDDLHKELGPIFISKILNHEVIHVADADANFEIYQHEGKFPIRDVPGMWREHSQYRNHKRGLFFMDGDEWRKARLESNKIIAMPRSLEENVANVASITEEFIDTWKTNPPKGDLRYYIYCWNLECIGSTALGRRLGFLDKLKYFNKYNKQHASEEQFIKDGCNIFTTSGPLLFKPSSVYRFLKLKSWRRYCEAADNEILNGERYVSEAIKECTSSNPSEYAKQSLLYKLIQNRQNLDMDTIRRIFVELFLASPNSTSVASVWVLYSLGRHPEVAQKIREEMSSVLAEESLSLKVLDKLNYLSGAIRESMRIRPTTAFLTRVLNSETEICGYHIPAHSIVVISMYTMGRNPDYFPYPEAFIPERWATRRKREKSSEDLILNRRAFSPFALGGRSCIGRNLAVMDMQILVMEALKAFDWTCNEVDYIFSLVGMPSKNIDLILKQHQNS